MLTKRIQGDGPIVPVTRSPIILPSYGPSGLASGGYALTHSMQVAGGSNITHTPALAGDQRTFTFATWVKINTGPLSAFGTMFAAVAPGGATSDTENLWYASTIGEFWAYLQLTSSVKLFHKYTSNVQPTDGWVHICAQKDTDTLTYTLEVNSVSQGFTVTTAFADFDGHVGSTNQHYIGVSQGLYALAAQLSDTHYIDGGLYDSSYFIDGTAPKEFTESHGQNGAHFLYNNASNLGENEVGTNWTDVSSPTQTTDVP